MSKKSLLRTSSPELVRHLWTVISKLESSSEATNLQNITNKADHIFGWKTSETEAFVQECSDCGLLTRLPDGTRGFQYFLPTELPDEADNDWYCFECHSAGKMLRCTACFRSFHAECLPPDAVRSGSDIVCEICQANMRERHCDIITLSKQFMPILSSVTSKYGSLLMHIPGDSGLINEVQYHLLAARPTDLGYITEKLNSGQYNHPLEFVCDFGTMYHNSVIVYGKESKVCEAAGNAYRDVKEAFTSWKEKNFTEEEKDEIQQATIVGNTESLQSGQLGEQNTPLRSSAVENRLPQSIDIKPELSSIVVKEENCNCNQKYKQFFLDMRDQFTMMFHDDVEKCKNELREKIRKKFMSEQSQVRAEMLAEFKRELENTREELNVRYANQLKFELQKLSDRHKKQLEEMKKKQWCYQCESEAIYYCCWNTSYCSVECQQEHWPSHRATCRRKKT